MTFKIFALAHLNKERFYPYEKRKINMNFIFYFNSFFFLLCL